MINPQTSNHPIIQTAHQNIKEILDSIEALRGKDYARKLTSYFGMICDLYQLADLACQSTQMVKETSDDLIKIYESNHGLEPEDLEKLAEFKKISASSEKHHKTLHILEDGILALIALDVQSVNATAEYRGIQLDLNTLLERINVDFFSKRHVISETRAGNGSDKSEY